MSEERLLLQWRDIIAPVEILNHFSKRIEPSGKMNCELVHGAIPTKDLLPVWLPPFRCGFAMVTYERCSRRSDVAFPYVMGLFTSVLGFPWITVAYIAGERTEPEHPRSFSPSNLFGPNEYEYGNGEKTRSRTGTSQPGKTLRNSHGEEKGSDVNDVPQANDTTEAKAACKQLYAYRWSSGCWTWSM